MKTLNLFAFLVVGSCALQACHNSDKTNNASTMAKDSTLDTVSKTAQALGGDLSKEENDFILKAAVGGLMEVAAGNMALQQSTNPKVKAFAQMMVTDHTKAGKELEAVAKSKGLALPATFPKEEQQHMDAMKTVAGDAFDKHYINMMVADHDKTVDLFTLATKYKDPDIKNFATKTLPVIQAHYKVASEMKAAMLKEKMNNGDDILNISTGKKKNQ